MTNRIARLRRDQRMGISQVPAIESPRAEHRVSAPADPAGRSSLAPGHSAGQTDPPPQPELRPPAPAQLRANPNPGPDPNRCQFTRSDGRRCQMSRTAKHATLCLFHAKQEQDFALAEENLAHELASLSGEFKTAHDVNHVLGKILSLLAKRRIPRRDAIAFAYISQLILQTLPAVRKEAKDALGHDAWNSAVHAALAGRAPRDSATAASRKKP